MLTAEKIQASIPEMDTLGSAEEAAVVTLLDKICSHYGDVYPPQFMNCLTCDDRRVLAYKYLKASCWKIDDAMKMVITITSFREENNADSKILFPCVFPLRGFEEGEICRTLGYFHTEKDAKADLCYHAIAPYYSSGYHYWDKEGHPVFYGFPGRCRVKELLKSVGAITPVGQQIKDTFLYYQLYVNLVQERVVQYANEKNLKNGGRPIIGSTVVLDAEGLNLGVFDSQLIDIARSIFQMGQKYFPEALHRLFVINCPSIVSYAFNLVKSSLDRRTKEKLVFCDKAQSLIVLTKIIDEDKIPKFLGGSCECSNGCVPGIDGECKGIAYMDNIYSTTTVVSIGAGKRHVIRLFLHPGENVLWEFNCTKSRGGNATDILFSVTFMSVDNETFFEDSKEDAVSPWESSMMSKGLPESTLPYKVQKSGQLNSDCDKFVASEKGILSLEWDNQASWLHGKHVQFCIKRT